MVRKLWIYAIATIIIITPIQTKAMNSQNITNNDNYYIDRYRAISTVPFTIPITTTKIQHIAVNTNIKNNTIIYNGEFKFVYTGKVERDTIIETITNSAQRQNIKNDCVWVSQKTYSGNDDIILSTEETITINCEYTSTITNSNRITIEFDITNTETLPTTYNYGEQCLVISPTADEELYNAMARNTANIIINNNANTIETIGETTRLFGNLSEQIENLASEQSIIGQINAINTYSQDWTELIGAEQNIGSGISQAIKNGKIQMQFVNQASATQMLWNMAYNTLAHINTKIYYMFGVCTVFILAKLVLKRH